MARAGMELGAHTLGHTVLTLESEETVLREVRASKEKIESELGRRVHDFAYCNGWYSDEVIRALIREGFRSAVTTEDYLNRVGGDPFTIKRKVLWENFSRDVFGGYSPELTGAHVDDLFGMLGVHHPVPGWRPHGLAPKLPGQPEVNRHARGGER
jgi:peptidoglycan/xylan/chitin deacetylase (PgdA/CDA1 family)